MAVEGRLKAETESDIDSSTRSGVTNKTSCNEILQTETDSKCRLCRKFDEKINNIIIACLILAKEQYIKRHDRV
jgi:hypothetical protein